MNDTLKRKNVSDFKMESEKNYGLLKIPFPLGTINHALKVRLQWPNLLGSIREFYFVLWHKFLRK